MDFLLKLLGFLADNSDTLVFILKLFLKVIIGKDVDVEQELNKQLEAIQAGADARAIQIDEGVAAALVSVELKHAAEIEAMESSQKERVDELRKNPAALARAAVRAARSIPSAP